MYSELVICSFIGINAVFCCPSSTTSDSSKPSSVPNPTRNTDNQVSSKSKSEQYCDYIKSVPAPKIVAKLDFQIYNGVAVSVRELPHVVAIGYSLLNEKVDWRCSGNLITRKWVLTAAHCLKKGINRVRVGAINLHSTNSPEKPQEILIANPIKHPLYSSKKNYYDIALLELEREVDITDGFAHPLCLPTLQSKPSNGKFTIAGWGYVNKTHVSII